MKGHRVGSDPGVTFLAMSNMASDTPTAGLIGLGNLGDPMAVSAGGALEHMRPGSTFVDMSTSSVDVAHEIQALAGPRGVAVMEAPVSFLAKAPLGDSRTSASRWRGWSGRSISGRSTPTGRSRARCRW